MISVHPIQTFWRRYRAHKHRHPDREVAMSVISECGMMPTIIRVELGRDPRGPALLGAARFFAHQNTEQSIYYERAFLALAAGHDPIARSMLFSMLIEDAHHEKHIERSLTIRAWKLSRQIVAISFQTFDGQQSLLDRYPLPKPGADSDDAPKSYTAGVTVCTGPEPVAMSDRDQTALWKQMQRLRKPVELRQAPADWHTIRDRFPWFDSVIDHMARDQSNRSDSWFQIRPTLLLGPPGIGKSAFARALADATTLPMSSTSMAAQTEARALLGTSRGYGSATPALVVATIARHEVANPLMFIDEIEKAGRGGWGGDPVSALLTMVERESSHAWEDPFLQAPVNLSHVNWLAGANALDGLDRALLSRFRVVELRAPGPEHWQTVKRLMMEAFALEAGLPIEAMPDLDSTVDSQLRELLRRRGDLRVVRRALEAVVKIDLQGRVIN